MTAMTAGERRKLESLIKRRAKTEKQKAKAQSKQLIANADDEMDRRFHAEDLAIEEVVSQAQAEVDKITARMNATLDAIGVHKSLRPDLLLRWHAGGFRDREHRAELRREAKVNVDAAIERRLAEIDAWELEALTDLASDALQTEEARLLLQSMPAADEALPAVEGIIGDIEPQPLAAIGNVREQRKQAILAAVGEGPQRSNREIGRLLGVDHKTVGKYRREVAGDEATHAGENPTEAGESPIGGVESA